MEELAEYERYLDHLCGALGHADRNEGFKDYCRGLMLPLERKSVEPLAAHIDPLHVCAKHQSLHHFVAESCWSDGAVLGRVREWVAPALGIEEGCYWIVDDSGHPKYGKHSVGVAHQYCGNLGKTANCQVAVSLSLATGRGSAPIDYRLYLPKEWADDAGRRKKTGVPEQVAFATKPEIALAQIRAAREAGVPPGVVLADAAYGDDTAWRDGVTEQDLIYMVGIRPATTVRANGSEPLPPKPWSGRGPKPKLLRRGPGHEPVAVKALAMGLPPERYRAVTWRDGTNAALSSRFACLRVRPAHQTCQATAVRPEEWLLVEWPAGDGEPAGYWLSTAPADATLEQLVFVAKMRWRIERDYRELKQEFGLSHYEGRNWRGFHHHATLCIAAYGFLTAHRLACTDVKKNCIEPKESALPENYVPRGRPAPPAACARLHRDAPPLDSPCLRQQTAALPLLRGV